MAKTYTYFKLETIDFWRNNSSMGLAGYNEIGLFTPEGVNIGREFYNQNEYGYSSILNGSSNPKFCFDGNDTSSSNGWTSSTNSLPCYIWVKVPEPRVCTSLSISMYRNNNKDRPQEFKLWGSNDGETWDELCHFTNTAADWNYGEVKTFEFCQHELVVVERKESTVLEKGYIKYYCNECGKEIYEYFYSDEYLKNHFYNIRLNITDFVRGTTPSSQRYASMSELYIYDYDHNEIKYDYTSLSATSDSSNVSKILDRNTGTMWHSDSTGNNRTITFTFPEPKPIGYIAFMPRQDGYKADRIASFNIEVSNDNGETWEKISEHTDCYIDWTPGDTKEFLIKEKPHTHNYILIEEKQATTEAEGYAIYSCEGCGDTYTVIYPILEHEHIYTLIEKREPTFVTEGYEIYRCEECGKTYTITYNKIEEFKFLREDYKPTSNDFNYFDFNIIELTIDALKEFYKVYTEIEDLKIKQDYNKNGFLFYEDILRIEKNIETLIKSFPEADYYKIGASYIPIRDWQETSNFSFNDVNRINHNINTIYKIGEIVKETYNNQYVNTFTFA